MKPYVRVLLPPIVPEPEGGRRTIENSGDGSDRGVEGTPRAE